MVLEESKHTPHDIRRFRDVRRLNRRAQDLLAHLAEDSLFLCDILAMLFMYSSSIRQPSHHYRSGEAEPLWLFWLADCSLVQVCMFHNQRMQLE